MKKYLFIFCALALLSTGCEDEPTVKRTKDLLIYGPPFDIYEGESYTFEAVLYQLNDTRTWSWSVEINGTELSTGEGEFFEVTFATAGTYTIHLMEGDREGSVDVEVLPS